MHLKNFSGGRPSYRLRFPLSDQIGRGRVYSYKRDVKQRASQGSKKRKNMKARLGGETCFTDGNKVYGKEKRGKRTSQSKYLPGVATSENKFKRSSLGKRIALG